MQTHAPKLIQNIYEKKMSQTSKLKSFAWKWISQDPEIAHRQAAIEILESKDEDALFEYFGNKLEFGTAGLRGEMGPGPNRMNLSVVRRTSYGIAQYIHNQGIDNPKIVVGYDARHQSREFAIDASVLFRTAGIEVYFIDKLAATPLLAHAVVQLGCHAGVMITASHNPPKDNGYKVYWGNGAQIIPPHDELISKEIDLIPIENIEFILEDNEEILTVPDSIIDGYYDSVMALRVHKGNTASVVYTPLHGVGTEYVETVLRKAGYTFHTVPEQREGNGDFPTVSFPNPEEPGAMDLALALGQSTNSDIVVANDPDADRLAVAARLEDGSFHRFTGDQIGLLLSYDLLKHGNWGDDPMVATTIVSSSQLKNIASHFGAAYKETLTGFKWIANQAITHDENGGKFVIGFEEALGYSVGDVARDKDGVSAALLIADLASFAKSKGLTLWDLHDELALEFGLALSDLVSIKKPGLSGAAEITAIMSYFRDNSPQKIGQHNVVETRDYLTKTITYQNGSTASLQLPESNVLVYFLDNDSRVILRPSGTEPKIKFYYEVQKKPSSIQEIAQTTAHLEGEIQMLRSAISEIMSSIE